MAKKMITHIEQKPEKSNNSDNRIKKYSNLPSENLSFPQNERYYLTRIIKIKLDQFFQSPLHIISKREEEHHYIDLYQMSKNTLLVNISDLDIKPINMKLPFSDFSKWVENLPSFKVSELFSNGDEMQVIKYFSGNLSYVLKRFTCYFNSKSSNKEGVNIIEQIIEKKYNEYSLMKIYHGCTFSVHPIAFNIIQIPKQNRIGTEILMYYGGEQFHKFFPMTDMNKLLILLVQACQALNYLQNYRIEQNDLKPANILIDENMDSIILRLIDFDIGRNESLTEKTQVKESPTGYTNLYASPEVLPSGNVKKVPPKEINPWKSQIYSLGVVFIEAIGFFPNEMDIKSLDTYKISEQKYKEFINKIQKFSQSIGSNESLKKNIMTILGLCLSYDPSKRPSIKELLVLLKDLNNKKPRIIEEEYLKLTNTFNNKDQECKIQFEEAKKREAMYLKHINEFTAKINLLEKEKNELHEIIRNYEKKIEEQSKKLKEQDILIQEKINIIQNLEKSKCGISNANSPSNNFNEGIKGEIQPLKASNNSNSMIYNSMNKESLFNTEQFFPKTLNSPAASNNSWESNLGVKLSDLLKKLEVNYIKIIDTIISELPLKYLRKIDFSCFTDSLNLDFKFLKNVIADKVTNNTPVLKRNIEKDTSFIENLDYIDSSAYFGQISMGIPEGKGILRSKNGEIFLGQFRKGIKSNFGINFLPDGSLFAGLYQDDLNCKLAIHISQYQKLKDKYLFLLGNLQENEFVGNKKGIKPNGDCFEITLNRAGQKSKGKFDYLNGTHYEGEYVVKELDKELYQGKGKFTTKDKGYYEG